MKKTFAALIGSSIGYIIDVAAYRYAASQFKKG